MPESLRDDLECFVQDFIPGGGGPPPPPPPPDPPIVNFRSAAHTQSEASPALFLIDLTLDRVLTAAEGNATIPFLLTGTDAGTRGTDWVLRAGPNGHNSASPSPIYTLNHFIAVPGANATRPLYFDVLQTGAGDVTFTLVPGNGSSTLVNATLGNDLTHAVTIEPVTANAVVSFELTSSNVGEGVPNPQQTFIKVVSSIPAPVGGLQIQWSIDASSTAVPGDYSIAPPVGTDLVIPAGTSERSFGITTQTDVTEDVTVVIDLDSVTGAHTVGGQSRHTLTIVDTPPNTTAYTVAFSTSQGLRIFETEAGVEVPVGFSVQVDGMQGGAPNGGIDCDFRYVGNGVNGAVPGTHFDFVSNAMPLPGGRIRCHIDGSQPSGAFTVAALVDNDEEDNPGTFTLEAVSFTNPPANATINLGTPNIRQLTVVDADTTIDPVDGDLRDYDGVPLTGARVTWSTAPSDITVSPAYVTVTHIEAVPGGDLEDLFDLANNPGPYFSSFAGGVAALFGPDMFRNTRVPDLAFAIRLAARIWEYKNPGPPPAIGATGNPVSIRLDNRVNQAVQNFSDSLAVLNGSLPNTMHLPTVYANIPGSNHLQHIGESVLNWGGNGFNSPARWDGEFTMGGDPAGPAGGNNIRDLVLYSDIPSASTQGDQWVDVHQFGMNRPSGPALNIYDNLIFSYLRWGHNPNGINICIGSAKTSDANGMLRMYDCQFRRLFPNTGSHQWFWTIHLGSATGLDLRTSLGGPPMFGHLCSFEHYMYLHGLTGPNDYAGFPESNFINMQGAGSGTPARTFFQITNRKEDLNRPFPSGGQLNLIRVLAQNIGQGGQGAQAFSVWGFDGLVYIKDCEVIVDNGGTGAGGLFFGHDFADPAFNRTTYPLPEGGNYSAVGPFEPIMYNTVQCILDGFTYSVPQTQGGKSPLELVGVESVKLVKFEFLQIEPGFSGGICRFNTSFGFVNSGFKVGRRFTREIDITDLVYPDSHMLAGQAFSDPLSTYPGWPQHFFPRWLVDGYHENWNKVPSNQTEVTHNANGDAYIDDWPNVVALQHARAGQTFTDGDMSTNAAWMNLTGRATANKNSPRLALSGGGMWMGAVVGEGRVVTVLFGQTFSGSQAPSNWLGGDSFVTRRIAFTTAPGTAVENTHFTVSDVTPVEVLHDYETENTVSTHGHYPSIGAFNENSLYNMDIDGLEPNDGVGDPVTFVPATTYTFTFEMTACEEEIPWESGTWNPFTLGSPTSVSVNIIPFGGYPRVYATTEGGTGSAQIDPANLNGEQVLFRRRLDVNANGLELASVVDPDFTVTSGSLPGLSWTSNSGSDEMAWGGGAVAGETRFMTFSYTPGQGGEQLPATVLIDLDASSGWTYTRCRFDEAPGGGQFNQIVLTVMSGGGGLVQPIAANTGVDESQLPNTPSFEDFFITENDQVVQNLWLVDATIRLEAETSLTGVRIINCRIDNATSAPHINVENNGLSPTGLVIENCEILDSIGPHNPGVSGPPQLYSGVVGAGFTMRDCHIHDIQRHGVYVRGDKFTMLEGNFIERVGANGGTSNTFDSSGVFVAEASNNIVSDVGRVAIIHDGNRHDADDYGAAPMMLLLLWKANQQSNLVHHHYNSHINVGGDPSDPTMAAEMVTSVTTNLSGFGFTSQQQGRFFDWQVSEPAATLHLATEIDASTASNRLTIVQAGPWESLTRCFEAATNTSAFQWCEVISHSTVIPGNPGSGFNDTHKADPSHRDREDFEALFTTVTTTSIAGQNSHDFRSSLSDWAWLNNSPTFNLNFVYNRTVATGSPPPGNIGTAGDMSDAGMMWYLLRGRTAQAQTPAMVDIRGYVQGQPTAGEGLFMDRNHIAVPRVASSSCQSGTPNPYCPPATYMHRTAVRAVAGSGAAIRMRMERNWLNGGENTVFLDRTASGVLNATIGSDTDPSRGNRMTPDTFTLALYDTRNNPVVSGGFNVWDTNGSGGIMAEDPAPIP